MARGYKSKHSANEKYWQNRDQHLLASVPLFTFSCRRAPGNCGGQCRSVRIRPAHPFVLLPAHGPGAQSLSLHTLAASSFGPRVSAAPACGELSSPAHRASGLNTSPRSALGARSDPGCRHSSSSHSAPLNTWSCASAPRRVLDPTEDGREPHGAIITARIQRPRPR
jgi:hypothetical protein